MSSSSSTSDGSEGEEGEMNSGELTALQKHVSFFDRNKDGVIYPWETFQGFRAIGCGVALSTLSAVLINGFLGPKTRTGKIPSPLLPIYVKNIHKGKHGSDSGIYDSEGRYASMQPFRVALCRYLDQKLSFEERGANRFRYNSDRQSIWFVPEKFEQLFKKHARINPNALTSKELKEMLQANRIPKDYNGWIASWTEWKILFALCKDKDGLLHKATTRAVYDGSLFLEMEKARKSSQKKAKKA